MGNISYKNKNKKEEMTMTVHSNEKGAILVEDETFNPDNIVMTKLVIPGIGRETYSVWLDNVLTENECKHLIEKSEEQGQEQALVNTQGGDVLITDQRNSRRMMIDDEITTGIIFERVKKYLPAQFPSLLNKKLVNLKCINERMRFLKQEKGEQFKPHQDGVFDRYHNTDNYEQSVVTIQLYLNQGAEGGETTFLEGDGLKVIPKTGGVLLFEHRIEHEGSEVLSGVKYAIRSDIMYSDK